MAVGLETGVPWIMCKQQDAPDPVVSFALSFRLQSVCENASVNSNELQDLNPMKG